MTAVEWLEEKLSMYVGGEAWNDVISVAKEMEKQQIIEACKYGNNFEQGDLRCEVYYNKTFKSE
jgi:hypothetical protein